MFYAKNFVYGDGTDQFLSENYNVTISSMNSEETSRIADVSLLTTKIYRKPNLYLYGVSEEPNLQFPMMLNTPEELTAEDFGLMSQKLFGQQNFKKLQIVQDDMMSLYFNAIFTNPEIIRIGGIIRGVKFIAFCDSPYAYNFPQTKNYDYVTPPSSSAIVFDNFSQSSYYLYPTIQFTMQNIANGDLTIVNTTDDSRTFTFTDLSANEIVTVDNDLQIITSSLSLLRLSKFNKNWMRFLPGRNNLTVTGNITNLKIIYKFSYKIGG